MSKKTLSSILQLILFLGLGIALILWQYNAMTAEDKSKMFASIRHVHWWMALPVFGIGFLSHWFRALRWKLLLQPLHIYPSTTNTTLAVLIGYLVNILLPRAGEVAKCTVLAKYEKVPVDKMVGTIVAERAFDMVCLVIIAFITVVIQYDIIYPYASDLYHQIMAKVFLDARGNIYGLRLAVLAGILLIGIAGMVFLYRRIRNSKTGHFIKGIGEGLKAIGQVKKKGAFLLYTLLIWTMYTVVINLGFLAMPALAQVAPLASMSIVVFGSVAMIVTPGGIGAYPPIVASILLLYGISFPVGNAFGWVSWMAQTGIVLILGLAALIILPLYNRSYHAGQTSTGTR